MLDEQINEIAVATNISHNWVIEGKRGTGNGKYSLPFSLFSPS